MSSDDKLMEQVKAILIDHSKKAIELAKQAVLEEDIKFPLLREALRYFIEEIWLGASHPALLSLTCEAVGGNPDETTGIGAAVMLLAGAADIHDDIIDRSETKDSKPTVYGKFGKEIAIIASDVLWIKGMAMLNEVCETFPPEKRHPILKISKQALLDLGSAESKEISLHRNLDLKPEEYLETIKLKVSIGIATAQIGAIIGNGTNQQIENLTQYGKTLGILTTIREEFINMFEPEELTNRFKNECLPLPILCALQDASIKHKILRLLEKNEITGTEWDEMIEIIYRSSEVRKLSEYMHSLEAEAIKNLHYTQKSQKELTLLLEAAIQDLPS